MLMPLALLAALAPSPADPPTVTVNLSSYAYAPDAVRLGAGRPVRLVLTNAAGKGHDFAAPEFFAGARLAPESQALVRRGRVEVPAGTSVSLLLTPARGRYRLRCTHFAHSALGMTGTIIVE